MTADAGQFSTAVTEIDRALAQQIRELRQRRRRVAELVAGERLFLPAEIADYLEELRALGVSARGVLMERDGWIMLAANYPEKALEWIAQKRTDLADPGFRQFYLTYDRAYDWDPADPRLAELADTMADRLVQQARAAGVDAEQWQARQVLSADEQALLAAHVHDYSPAWLRLTELVAQRVQATAS